MKRGHFLALSLAALATLVAAWGGGALAPLERAFLDARYAMLSRPASDDVLIVAIDAASLRAQNEWPWSRTVHARLIRQLDTMRPRAVFYDVDFSLPSPDAAADRALSEAIAAHGDYPFVLPMFWQRAAAGNASGYTLTKPLPALEGNARQALVNLMPAADGLVRGVVHVERFGSSRHLSVAAMLGSRTNLDPGREYPIDFAIRPASLPRVSFVDVLNGNVAADLVEDRVVFVGATAVELGDIVAVPVHQALPGVITQALAYLTLEGSLPVEVQPMAGLGAAVLVLLIMPWMGRRGWRSNLVVMAAGVSVTLALAFLAHAARNILVPVVPVMCAWVLGSGLALIRTADRDALRAWLRTLQLERREALISGVLSASVDGILVLDAHGVIRDANAASARLLGVGVEALRGMDSRALMPALTVAKPGRLELEVGAGREQTPVEVSLSRVRDDDASGFTAIIRDVSERKRQQALLEHQATHDALTGLPNRITLARALTALVAARSGALLMLDLDRFKEVNDTLGHSAGDEVLTVLGARLRGALASEHLIARLGGDEFAVVVKSRERRVLESLGRRIVECVRAPISIGDEIIEVGGSVGIALCPDDGQDGGLLLQRADVAMYVAKQARSGVEFYRGETDRNSIRHLKMTRALRQAIAERALTMVYQPKVRLTDGACVGVEALVRWTDPELGLVSPGEFVALAEDSDLIVPLTRLTIEQALRDAGRWVKSGMNVDVAVNLSARALEDPALARDVLRWLDRFALGAERLELEITESAFMSDPERAMASLEPLANAGVRFAMDDFGTGFSSLSYLKHFSFHTLKIDRCFVRDVHVNPSDEKIVRSTLRMAHSMGIEVVAEGIEDEDCASRLLSLDCDLGQGYHFSPPMPVDELEEWCTARAHPMTAVVSPPVAMQRRH